MVVLLQAAATVAAVGGDPTAAASVELLLFYSCWSHGGVALVAVGLVLEVSLIATWGQL